MSNSDHPSASSSEPSNPSRRNLLFVGGAAAAAAGMWFGWPAVQTLIPRRFAFEPLPNIPGFRQFTAGQMSSSAFPLVGIDAKNPYSNSASARRAIQQNLCASLFGPEPVPRGVVPIASFSDYNCPYCRVLSGLLIQLRDSMPNRVRITWHEWPTLGRASRVMARAALAARRQGGYSRIHESLLNTRFLPSSGYLKDLAKRNGLNPELLLVDMKSQEVEWEIKRSTALAQEFGFRGTPSLVVGRTAVSGAISASTLKALVHWERETGPVPGCA